MIKSLRKKFILVSMLSMFVVLFLIMTGLNSINYYKMTDKADRLTKMLADNGGEFDTTPNGKDNPSSDKNKTQPPKKPEGEEGPENEGISPETPFETRYFSVSLDEDGNYVSSNMGNIAAITETLAKKYAKEVFKNTKDTGFKDIYRYRISATDSETMVIFVDCRQEIASFRTTLITSVTVSALGLLAVFILVLIFSGRVFKPVAESYEKQKQFITDAGHEIKTPLTIIDANTEITEMEQGETKWTKSTRNQIRRLNDLTQQLITLSKMDEGGGEMQKEKFSISDAVEETLNQFEVLAGKTDKTFDMKIQPNVDYLGDERAIRQLVGILMDNAIKYSINGSIISVLLEKKGKKIYIRFYNKADNVVKGRLDVLFERFYRTDASRNSQTGGSGIGLSVAKAIVTAHKGKIAAESEDGKSLTISVIL